MAKTPLSATALLERETAHLSYPDRQSVAAALIFAVQLVREFRGATVEAVTAKLLCLPDAPPSWVRVLIAKAAVESQPALSIAA